MKNETAKSITHSKNRVASRLKTVFFWSACALAPIVMICALCAWGGIYPFGPESFLTEDLKYQYIDFFTWYREVLTGEANIFYSFAQGLGSNTWGLYSYYLASPFNLIILLFDEDGLTLAVFIIVALKLASMNVTATWFLKRRFGLTDTWSIILALCYTWSTWSVTNLRNPLWLDALIILPLAAWACWRLIRRGSFIPLAVLIAIDVICCWYMAYITLVFLCLFVLFELAVYLFDGNEVDRRWVLGRAWRFTGSGISRARPRRMDLCTDNPGNARRNGIQGNLAVRHVSHLPYTRIPALRMESEPCSPVLHRHHPARPGSRGPGQPSHPAQDARVAVLLSGIARGGVGLRTS